CHRSCSTLLAQKTAPSFLPSECRALTLLHAADSRHSPRLNVTAILTINRRVRHSRTIEARFEIEQRWFDPRVAADVRDKRGIEAHVALEAIRAHAVAVEEVSGVADREAVAPQQPLIDFDLALVALLPVFIDRDARGLRRGLVVHSDQLAAGV